VLIFVKPGIKVKAVVDATSTELDERDTELGEQRDPDAEVLGRLFLSKAANSREGQGCAIAFIHGSPNAHRERGPFEPHDAQLRRAPASQRLGRRGPNAAPTAEWHRAHWQ
jgi:hypothetical protein